MKPLRLNKNNELQVITRCDTRFNSAWIMIGRLICMKAEICIIRDLYKDTNDLSPQISDEWETIDVFHSLATNIHFHPYARRGTQCQRVLYWLLLFVDYCRYIGL